MPQPSVLRQRYLLFLECSLHHCVSHHARIFQYIHYVWLCLTGLEDLHKQVSDDPLHTHRLRPSLPDSAGAAHSKLILSQSCWGFPATMRPPSLTPSRIEDWEQPSHLACVIFPSGTLGIFVLLTDTLGVNSYSFTLSLCPGCVSYEDRNCTGKQSCLAWS